MKVKYLFLIIIFSIFLFGCTTTTTIRNYYFESEMPTENISRVYIDYFLHINKINNVACQGGSVFGWCSDNFGTIGVMHIQPGNNELIVHYRRQNRYAYNLRITYNFIAGKNYIIRPILEGSFGNTVRLSIDEVTNENEFKEYMKYFE